MTNTTDTNQASEYELEQHLLNDKAFQHILKFAPESQRELMTFELARYIEALIRTEKLKLLAEVRERVIGEVPSKMNTDNWKYDRRVAELKIWQHQAIDNKIKSLEEV